MKKKKDNRTLYHKKYYRIRSLAKLRKKVKTLEQTIKNFLESEEGIAYRNRKTKEYQKKYRQENKERIKKYQEEYKTL